MFDTDEERLLTDLLRDIADVDRRLDVPPDLESRVMARWDAREALRDARAQSLWRRPNVPVRHVAAAMIVIALVILAVQQRRVTVRPDNALSAPVAHDVVAPPAETHHSLVALPTATGDSEPADTVRQRRGSRPVLRRAPSTPTDVVDFIPLGPLTPNDLSQSLKIIPVRIGDTPAELLLGEDGMARAIRISSSSSDAGAFWRSR